MGSLPRAPRLSPAEIVARYLEGESRGLLGLRAGVGDSVIVSILNAAGVELRTSVEGFKAARDLRVRQGVKRRQRSTWPKAA